MIRYCLLLVICTAVVLAQTGTILPSAAPLGNGLEIPAPSKPELDPADARAVLESQRMQQWAWNEAYRKKAEWLEAEKAANKADQDVLLLLNSMKDKYHCSLCDLGWNMQWTAQGKLKFAEVAKAEAPKPKNKK